MIRHVHPTSAIWLGIYISVGFAGLIKSADGVAVGMKAYDSTYYTIYTDLDQQTAREAGIRATKMFEEYRECTKDFSGVVREKFAFHLYRSARDYYKDGGMPGTAGVFLPKGNHGKLMAIAGETTTANTWHTVQHEGFHQFAHAAIDAPLPTWLNEGLAEYFGEGIFTGDGFVMGVVPPWRLKRLKDSISNDKVKPFRALMLMSADEWRADLSILNYDQAWSMVHFLLHGEEGKYRKSLAGCIREVANGRHFQKAWMDTLGSIDDVETGWKQYWISQPEDPTAVEYSRATVSILTSFLARATARKQTFESFDQFASVAAAGKLEMNPDDWLPAPLLAKALKSAREKDRWDLGLGVDGLPVVSATTGEGVKLVGSYEIHDGRVEHVEVKEEPGPPGRR